MSRVFDHPASGFVDLVIWEYLYEKRSDNIRLDGSAKEYFTLCFLWVTDKRIKFPHILTRTDRRLQECPYG